MNISLSAQCTSDFSYVADELDIAFSQEATGDITSYYWDFGDGNYSYEENPMHTYESCNTYSVNLSVFSSTTGCTDAYSENITVVDSSILGTCNADFDYVATGSGSNISFYNLSEYGCLSPNTFYWDFGDGGASIITSPSHAYSTGFYTVCLTISTDSCSDTICKEIYVFDSATCNTSFIYDIEDLYAGFSADASSDPDLTDFYWDFGDGSLGAGKYTSHIYTAEDFYTVCQSSEDDTGCIAMQCREIAVFPIADSMYCISGFSFVADGLIFNFSEDVFMPDPLSEITSYEWDFGDGLTSTITAPSHVYPDSGYYTVCFYFENSEGCADKICTEVYALKTSSIENNFSSTHFLISPNPASSSIDILSPLSTSLQVKLSLINTIGISILKLEGIAGNNSPLHVDVNSLSSGIYLLSIESEGLNTYTNKILITR